MMTVQGFRRRPHHCLCLHDWRVWTGSLSGCPSFSCKYPHALASWQGSDLTYQSRYGSEFAVVLEYSQGIAEVRTIIWSTVLPRSCPRLLRGGKSQARYQMTLVTSPYIALQGHDELNDRSLQRELYLYQMGVYLKTAVLVPMMIVIGCDFINEQRWFQILFSLRIC